VSDRLPRPEPREAFKRTLRSQLMAQASTALVRRETIWSRFQRGLVRPAFALAAVVLVLLAGAGKAAADSLPGDPAFGLKAAAEELQLAFAFDDTTRLGLGRPDHEPKATDFVPQMIKLITELIEHGAAYESGGDVYYRVTRFPPYGKLSNRQIDDMVAGSRDDLEAAAQERARARLRPLEGYEGRGRHLVGFPLE